MKKLVACLIVAGVALSLTDSASAISAFSKQFKKTYVDDNKDAPKGFADAVTKAKCNVCHFGKTKKNRNDYAAELSKLLDKKDPDFKTAAIKADPKTAEKKILEAFEKVAKMKNKEGDVFGDLIKKGKLPGTEPPAAAK